MEKPEASAEGTLRSTLPTVGPDGSFHFPKPMWRDRPWHCCELLADP